MRKGLFGELVGECQSYLTRYLFVVALLGFGDGERTMKGRAKEERASFAMERDRDRERGIVWCKGRREQ